jgi:hypothetical protein
MNQPSSFLVIGWLATPPGLPFLRSANRQMQANGGPVPFPLSTGTSQPTDSFDVSLIS